MIELALSILGCCPDAPPVSGSVMPSLISELDTPVEFAFAGTDVANKLPAASTAAANQVRFLRFFPIIIFLPSRVWLMRRFLMQNSANVINRSARREYH